MAEHAVCVTVKVKKNDSSDSTVLINKKITKVSPKLTLAEIVDEVVGDIEITDSVNYALDHQNFKVELFEKENGEPFSIDSDQTSPEHDLYMMKLFRVVECLLYS